MRNIFRKFQIVFTIFLVIGFSIPILSYLGEYISNPSIYQDRKANMRLEYTNINPPPNSEAIKESTFNKFTRIWINTDYETKMKKEDIEKYYLIELTKKGWEYQKIDHDGTICYVKQDLLFEVAINDNKIHTSLHYRGKGPNF